MQVRWLSLLVLIGCLYEYHHAAAALDANLVGKGARHILFVHRHLLATPLPAPSPDYWGKAIDLLEDDLRTDLSSVSSRKLDIISAVLKSAEDKRQLCIRKQWRYKTPSGGTIVLRDVLDKIVAWVDRFKLAGDIAIQYDPVHAALPRAAVRFLLDIACGDAQVFGSMTTVLETTIRVIGRCRILEDMLCNSHPCDISAPFEDALMRLYAEVLRLLARSVRYFGRSTGPRILSSALQAGLGSVTIKPIEDREAEVLKFASLFDTKAVQGLHVKVPKLADNTTDALLNLDARFTRLIDTNTTMHKIIEEKKLKLLLRWLSSTSVLTHHRSVASRRLPDSTKWLLNHPEFRSWRDSSEFLTFLLHGVRGCGKSTILSTVVDHFLPQPHINFLTPPCASFYCQDSPSEPDRASPVHILRCILKQLAAVLSVYERRVEDAERNGTETRELELNECVDLFPDVTATSPAYIAVDAIDELPDEDRAIVLEALKQVMVNSASVIKVFITTRDNVHLDTLLDSETKKIRVTSTHNHDDVNAFIEGQLNAAMKKHCILNGNAPTDMLELISQALVKGSGEMWNSSVEKKNQQDILAALTNGLCGDLNQIYGQTLDRMLNLDPVAKQVVQQVFSWLLFSREPLTAQVFYSILQLDPDVQLSGDIDLIDICYNLVVLDPELQTISFCHSSVRDFLRQYELFSPKSASHLLATICLRQCSTEPGGSPFAGDGSPIKELFHYAAVHWADHVRESDPSAHIQDALLQEIIQFVFTEGDFNPNPAFIVWLQWVEQYIVEFPKYHPLRTRFELIISATVLPVFTSCVFGLPSLLDYILATFPGIGLAGRTSTVSTLLAHKADPCDECGAFGTPITVASFHGHSSVVRMLLHHPSSPRTRDTFATAFDAACRGAREKVAIVLAKEFSAIWALDDFTNTMQRAIEAGFCNLVERLSRPTIKQPIGMNGANTEATAKHLVQVAIKQGKVAVLKSLLRTYPQWAHLMPPEAISIAALSGHTGMVLFLQGQNMSPQIEGPSGSALRSASLMGHEHTVRTLLGWGLDANDTFGTIGGSLHAAAQNGHANIVQLLLAEGAAVDAVNGAHGTALHVAAYNGHQTVVEILLDQGADMYHCGTSKDALHVAVEGGHEEIAAFLLTRGYQIPGEGSLPNMIRGDDDQGVLPLFNKLTGELQIVQQAVPRSQCVSSTEDVDDEGADSDDTFVPSEDPSNSKDTTYYGHDKATILEFSASVGDIPSLRYQLSRPYTDADEVRLALRSGASQRQLESFKALLEVGAKYINLENGLDDCLIAAAENGRTEFIQKTYHVMKAHGIYDNLKVWAASLWAAVLTGHRTTLLTLLKFQAEPSGRLLTTVIPVVDAAATERCSVAAGLLCDWLLHCYDIENEDTAIERLGTRGISITRPSFLDLCLDMENKQHSDEFQGDAMVKGEEKESEKSELNGIELLLSRLLTVAFQSRHSKLANTAASET
ncbi:unnamed protein product [Penicillium glandicola]